MKLEVGELVRLRSAVRENEWLIYSHAGHGENHTVETVSREHLKDVDHSEDPDTVTWGNTGFIVREENHGEEEKEKEESGKKPNSSDAGHMVRLDAARYVDNFLYVHPGKKKQGSNNIPIHVLSKQKMESNGTWTHGIFVVEYINGQQIRLRCKDFPDTYLFVSEEKSKQETWTKTYYRHKVFAAHKDELTAGALWGATVFDVTQEGTEAAIVEEQEAEYDDNIRKIYEERCKQFFYSALGTTEILLVFRNDCPGVPGLWDLVAATAIYFLVDPVVSVVMLLFAHEDVRKGNKPLWFQGIDGLSKFILLALCIATAIIAWPAGYSIPYSNSKPRSYESAVEEWRTDTNAGTDATPPDDLEFCDAAIAELAFWTPLSIIIIAFGIAALGCLGILEEMDKQEKKEKAKKEEQEQFVEKYDV